MSDVGYSKLTSLLYFCKLLPERYTEAWQMTQANQAGKYRM